MPIRVTVWNEYVHEQTNAEVREVYPEGIHRAVATGLEESLGEDVEVRTATLDEPSHGLTEDVVQSTDVLFWWGHAAHDRVEDEIADRVVQAVLRGMGLVVLHSGHDSKPFKRLMGTACQLKWREEGEPEQLWVVDVGHPLVHALPEHFQLPKTEMYGEPFGIPAPDELVMISSFAGGEVFRSLCTWRRGRGRVVYFRPGHETYPIYFDAQVRQVLANAARWAAPQGIPTPLECRNVPSS